MICILNFGDGDAEIEISFFYSDMNPIELYSFEVGARRVRNFRVNDLINLLAVPVETDWGR